MAGLTCEEEGLELETGGGRLLTSLRSPAPHPLDSDSDGEDGSVSGDEAEPEEEAERLAEALAGESTVLPLANYPELQPALGSEGRHTMVLWMLAAARRHRFAFRTSTLAVSLFDRFLSCYVIKPELVWLSQLAAIACLSVAAKQEETTVPLLADLQVLCELRFDARQVQRMEILVLATLTWRVATPTSATFLEHLLRVLVLRPRARRSVRAHARHVIQRTLPHAAFLQHAPSALAAAALHHALRSLRSKGRLCVGVADPLGVVPAAAACRASLEELGPSWTARGWYPLAPPGRAAASAPPQLVIPPPCHPGHRRQGSLGERESPVSMLDAAAALEGATLAATAPGSPSPSGVSDAAHHGVERSHAKRGGATLSLDASVEATKLRRLGL